nr:hypothetical protein [Alkalibacter rhizosphaerae]
MDKISGTIENIIYHNEINNFTVMDLDAGGKMITITGNFPP